MRNEGHCSGFSGSTYSYLEFFKHSIFVLMFKKSVSSLKTQTILRSPNLNVCSDTKQQSCVFHRISSLSHFLDVCCPSLKFHYIKITAAGFTFFFVLLFSLLFCPFFHLASDRSREGASNDFRSIKYL